MIGKTTPSRVTRMLQISFVPRYSQRCLVVQVGFGCAGATSVPPDG